MMGLAQIGFTAPMILWALALLPVIWWLLRLTPPRPQRVAFPPTRLLAELARREETPSKSPWWLTLLRLLLAAFLIIALAGPVWRPDPVLSGGSGPLWVLIDNGWSATPSWEARVKTAERLIGQAEAESRPVVLAATADGGGQAFAAAAPGEAIRQLRGLEARPWAAERGELLDGLKKAAAEVAPGTIVWLAEPLDHATGKAFSEGLAALRGSAEIVVYTTGGLAPAALAGLENASDGLKVSVLRLPEAGIAGGTVRALDIKAREVGRTDFSFEAGKGAAEAVIDLPSRLRNDIVRLEIVGGDTAGGVQLIDERWRRRTVGLLSGASSDLAQPLLSPLHYIGRALEPFADIVRPSNPEVGLAAMQMVKEQVSVIVLADIGRLDTGATEAMEEWIAKGGVLLRFAGPRLAASSDGLIPVKLRTGGRTLGGSLTWEEPQTLAGFADASPFAGLAVPSEVTVTRQVLAEPDSDLPERTWASLADGTPLVTAVKRGQGWIVLFHVTADTTWSNLPISGTFVEMLRRIVAFSTAKAKTGGEETASSAEVLLPPLRLLDGRGRFSQPASTAQPIPVSGFDETRAGRDHPPGLYGTNDGFRALNLLSAGQSIAALDLAALDGVATRAVINLAGPEDLRHWLFILALILLFADAVIVLVLGGAIRLPPRLRGTAAGLMVAMASGLALLALDGTPANAQATAGKSDPATEFALRATRQTHIGFVLTGDNEVDDISRMGLRGLTRELTRRTALEPAEPIGIDLDQDELAFFSLLYWPVDAKATVPSARAMSRVDAFLRNGGSILFDTRDQGLTLPGTSAASASPATLMLRRILHGLDIPPLEPVPEDHVLTKSFFILSDFPGRWTGSPLWVQVNTRKKQAGRPVRAGDGVSPILITANDMAGAWAIRDDDSYAFPTVPADMRQREMAYRVGVNIVMYVLTGNYKADQVHMKAIIERLGQ